MKRNETAEGGDADGDDQKQDDEFKSMFPDGLKKKKKKKDIPMDLVCRPCAIVPVYNLTNTRKSERRWLWHFHTSKRSPCRGRLRRPRLFRHEEEEEIIQEKGDGGL